MKAKKTATLIAKGFILLSGICFLSVGLMAFYSPQSVMDLVSVKLTSNDAVSSIRGVYGGVGLTLFITLMYKMYNNFLEGLGFLILLWGSYAGSRLITIVHEGPLGDFGRQWLGIESLFLVLAILLYAYHRKNARFKTTNSPHPDRV